ncbi:nuclear transport factor 2 family protein [Actinomadura rupiterrae]|uniref:nuclear transport factor 2 family protein n=1 Tax=Actinomadura rupiterrae TaxID=559627 RepID=UPI0020A2F80E|nr:nuclear transport factor 2 family protein [Actinomadura rupiterrae]MCP2340290.1 3-phenylpropionate/cinnamic acid dioxygenase small subunit [Actinomadura rupiterrae]
MALYDMTAEARLITLADRAEIATLLDRYARALDDRTLDETLPALLTPDATVGPPSEDHAGLGEVTRHLKDSLTAYGPTQHVFSNYLIDVKEDEASVRANTRATCVLQDSDALYSTGGVLTATAARTPYGWRLKSVTISPTWETKTPPKPNDPPEES